MPSIATYTPLESLLFFQSVARHGADADSLVEISESLNSNKFIRDDGKYSPGRLKPEALKGLYTALLQAEREEKVDKEGSRNGHLAANGSNPRKRKLSPASIPSPQDSPKDDERFVTELVDRLYAQYKEQIVKEIRHDEEEYERLQKDIAELVKAGADEHSEEIDRTAQEAQAREHTLQTVAGVSSAVKEGDSDPTDGRDVMLQAQPSAKEEAQGVDSYYTDGASGLTPRPAQDPTRTGSEEVSRSSLPPIQKQPPPQAQAQSDMNAHQFSSPSLVNAQRAPPLGNIQSGQSQVNRTLPPPAPYPQQPGYGPVNAQHAFQGPTSPRSPVILPPPPGMPHMSHQRTPSDGGLPRSTPVPLTHPQTYQPYPPYNFSQAPWPHQPHPSQQYPQHHPPYATHHFYPQPMAGRHPYPPQSPNQSPYSYHPPPGPVNRPIHPSTAQPGMPPTGYPRLLQPASAMTTPVHDRTGQRGLFRMSGSHTPWTPKASSARDPRPTSPVRPEREVSPLSDPGSPSMPVADEPAATPASSRKVETLDRRGLKSSASTKVKSEKPPSSRMGRPSRRKRGDSNASSMIGSESRSQSLASFASESRAERASTTRNIKNEPPSTPVPLASDNDQQRSSGLRQARGTAAASQLDTTRSTMKRKRDSTHEASSSPSLPTPRRPPSHLRPRLEVTDPDLVSLTKNFARLTGTIMNDVTSHKYAGIFAKPLSEREAPGYKDLIYRPQDLRSIKTAIGRGSRSANAAIDDVAGGEDGTGAEAVSKISSTGSPAAGGTTILKKTDELAPPKGIVNSSQLEMELMRLFANAIMFNPLPGYERGLGPRFKMQRVDGEDDVDHDSTREGDDEGAKGYSYVQIEEEGIIADTREMFEHVEKSVGDWRSAELGPSEIMPPRSTSMGLGLRGGSVSSALGEENEDVSDTEGTKADGGTVRKRRRIEA